MRASSVKRQPEGLDEMGATAMPYVTAALRSGTEAEKRGAAAFLIGRVTLQRRRDAGGTDRGAERRRRRVASQRLAGRRETAGRTTAVALCTTLVELAKNTKEDTAYRVRAVRAIAKLGAAGRDAVPDLLQLARDDSTPELQRSAFDAIAKVATPEASEAFFLEVLKSNPQKDLRRLAATATGPGSRCRRSRWWG